MTDKRILSLVKSFRQRIDQAQEDGCFLNSKFEEFPVQCCGITSSLLAEFLLSYEIETIQISSKRFDTHEPHAWLVVKDDRINHPRGCFDNVPNAVMKLLGSYGNNSIDRFKDSVCYDESDISNGLIIDITGDQFGESPVYVGYMDAFHRRFDFISAYEHDGLSDYEHIRLYNVIMNHQ